jgi:hypothetical protein
MVTLHSTPLKLRIVPRRRANARTSLHFRLAQSPAPWQVAPRNRVRRRPGRSDLVIQRSPGKLAGARRGLRLCFALYSILPEGGMGATRICALYKSSNPTSPMNASVHIEILVPSRRIDGDCFDPADFTRLHRFLLQCTPSYYERCLVPRAWKRRSRRYDFDYYRYVIFVPRQSAKGVITAIQEFVRGQFNEECLIESFQAQISGL